MTRKSITIVLASIDSTKTIEASVQGFLNELDGRGQVIVADASRDGSTRNLPESVIVTSHEGGTLAPKLWREGLIRSDSDLVAFSTGQMVPRPGWLNGLLARMESSGAAGVGGPIAAGRGLASIDKALYLLRYANYLPPVPESSSFDPPGDNAIYRRQDLDAVASSWADGFWEVEVHAALRSMGRSVTMASGAAVEFTGGCRFGSALGHRWKHARRYGAGRSAGSGLMTRLARVIVSPVVPALLLARIIRNLRSRGEPIGRWLPALPHLGVLLATWSIGEGWGTIAGPNRCRLLGMEHDKPLKMNTSGTVSP